MNTPKNDKKSGAILVIVMVILVSFTLFVSALLQLGSYNAQETEQQVREAQAFWLAEEGVQQARLELVNAKDGIISPPQAAPAFDASTGRFGTYEVQSDGTGFISIGRLTIGSVTVTNRIRFETSAVDESYKDAIAAPGMVDPWTFILGGTGDPVSSGGSDPIGNDWKTYKEVGGADAVYGNITTGNGAVHLGGGTAGNHDGSSVNPSQDNDGETYNNFPGNVSTSGGTITTVDGATIAGTQNDNAPIRTGPDLIGMDYPNTATHNLTTLFNNEGVTSGRLPEIDYPELHNLVRRNGDDYYFETGSSHNNGEQYLPLGDGRVYYADGDIWFDRSGPRQFNIDGTATIVASGDIHIGDSLRYVKVNDPDPTDDDPADLLALVALGTYYADDTYKDGGNIYFGDANGNGTLTAVDAFMFAAHDFYYNYYYQGDPDEPKTGFTVLGNFVALNQLHIYRDWYGTEDEPNPAIYDPNTDTWNDAITGTELTDEQINGYTDTVRERYWNRRRRRWEYRDVDIEVPGLRHYQMIVKYDERIYDPETQLSGLPQAGGSGVPGGQLIKWEHADDV